MRHGATGNPRKVWGLPGTRLCVCRSSNTAQQLRRQNHQHAKVNFCKTVKLQNMDWQLTVWLEENGLITPLIWSHLYNTFCVMRESKVRPVSLNVWKGIERFLTRLTVTLASREIQFKIWLTYHGGLPSLWNTKRTCRPSVHTKRLDSIHLKFWREINRMKEN